MFYIILIKNGRILSDFEADIELRTDHYFKLTKKVVEKHGDVDVTYAVFMRRPVIYCPKIAMDWISSVVTSRGHILNIQECFIEGAWVGAGEVLMYISGKLSVLTDLETLYLQKLGGACVAAYNTFGMASDLPKVGFIAMDARHCAGAEMQELMAYGASVGSKKAQKEQGAIGFIGSANDITSHFFGKKHEIHSSKKLAQLDITTLTKAGKEVFNIIKPEPNFKYYKFTMEYFKKVAVLKE